MNNEQSVDGSMGTNGPSRFAKSSFPALPQWQFSSQFSIQLPLDEMSEGDEKSTEIFGGCSRSVGMSVGRNVRDVRNGRFMREKRGVLRFGDGACLVASVRF